MRNWNSNVAVDIDKNDNSFYSTYEELKLVAQVKSVVAPRCFYSTYEELKPHFDPASSFDFFKFLQYLWGIETQFQHFHQFFL